MAIKPTKAKHFFLYVLPMGGFRLDSYRMTRTRGFQGEETIDGARGQEGQWGWSSMSTKR